MIRFIIFFLIAQNCSNLQGQPSLELLNQAPLIEIPSTWSSSLEMMRFLEDSDYSPIDETLITEWYSTLISLTSTDGQDYSRKALFFNNKTRLIGRIEGFNENYQIGLFCKFDGGGAQKFAVLASFDNDGIISIKHCFAQSFEMMGFFMSKDNEITILTSGEDYVTEVIVTVNSYGLFQTLSYNEIYGYQFN